jgi:hypothetical protein
VTEQAGAAASNQTEAVYTAFYYYGAPRVGVADFGGEPHEYECVFDEVSDDYSDVYLLRPLSEAEFRAAVELWEIGLQWRRNFQAGVTPYNVDNASPEDAARHRELSELIKVERARQAWKQFRGARARFERIAGGSEDNQESRWRVPVASHWRWVVPEIFSGSAAGGPGSAAA